MATSNQVAFWGAIVCAQVNYVTNHFTAFVIWLALAAFILLMSK